MLCHVHLVVGHPLNCPSSLCLPQPVACLPGADWGVKSRANPINITMAYFGHIDKYEWVRDSPFPANEEWKAYPHKSAWGQLP